MTVGEKIDLTKYEIHIYDFVSLKHEHRRTLMVIKWRRLVKQLNSVH